MAMNDKLFAELMASIEEAGHIVREETAPSRTFTVEREPLDVVGIREGYKLSQTRFAALLGISVKTLRNWEQGRRTPAGPERAFSCKWQQNTPMQCGMLCIPPPSDVNHLAPWPTRMAEQAQAVRAALTALGGPAFAAQVAAAFASAPPDRVAELLETLVTLGPARAVADGRYAAG